MKKQNTAPIAKKPPQALLIFLGLCIFGGCAAQKHTEVMKPITNNLDAGFLEEEVFDGRKIKDNVDVVYLLELGNLYSIRGDFKKSNRVLEEAFRRYTAREEEAIIGVRKAGNKTVDVLFGEGSRDYELADYEKVYLHTLKVINYLMLGDVESARVETMRGIERHKMIREYSEFEAAQVETSKREAQAKIHNLNALAAKMEEESRRAHKGRNPRRARKKIGYNLEQRLTQLETKADLPPELKHRIGSVRNSYENSFTYLLAALNFVLCGENINAEPSLKNAVALTDNRCVRNMFFNADRRGYCLESGKNLFVFAQVGLAPTKENLTIPFPNPLSQTTCQFSIARIQPTPTCIGAVELISSDGKLVGRLERLTDMELLPLKEYEEKLPENVTKAVLRVVSQTVRDTGIVGMTDEKDKLLRNMVQLVLSSVNLAVAKADTRTWVTAPKSVWFYSGGFNGSGLKIRVKDKAGNVIDVKPAKTDPRKVNVINLRCLESVTYVQSRSFGFSSEQGFSRSVSIPEHLDRLTIAVSSGNIRDHPTTESRIISRLRKGRQVGLEIKQGEWCRVVLPSGQKGWAHEMLFGSQALPHVTEKPAMAPSPDIKLQFKDEKTASNQKLSQTTQEDSTQVPRQVVIGNLEPRNIVTQNNIAKGWKPVAESEQRIHRAEVEARQRTHLQKTEESSLDENLEKKQQIKPDENLRKSNASQKTETSPLALQKGKVPQKNYVLIRKTGETCMFGRPSLYSKKTGIIFPGTKAECLGKEKGFYLIRHENKKGYVYKSFCEEIDRIVQ